MKTTVLVLQHSCTSIKYSISSDTKYKNSFRYFNCFDSYLKNRTFILKVGNDMSEKGIINAGSQGSAFGSFLYTIYSPDLPLKHNQQQNNLNSTRTIFCHPLSTSQNKEVDNQSYLTITFTHGENHLLIKELQITLYFYL